MATINKKAAAEILFKEGIEQKEIARMLAVSEATVSSWVIKGGWKNKRINHSIRKQTAEEDTLTALAHQSRVIRMLTEKYAETMTEDMSIQDLKDCLIPKGDVDAFQKLWTTVKGKELDWSAMVKILREFSQWLRDEDIELAQRVVDPIDKYLNEKRTKG
jgi:predicted transcriptional regulator